MEKTVNFGEDLKTKHSEALEELKRIMPFLFDLEGNLLEKELKQLVRNYAEIEPSKFEFNWAGKEKAKQLAFANYEEGSLEADGVRGKNHHKTQNVIIEGENLQVLHLLRKSYKGKVKCIYIDPPYNTGNDFVYNDKFELDIKKYLIESGQIDEATGEQLVDYISKDDGKKHSKWLSFMYPRLLIARDLLTEDGVIFISIDDNEQANLKLMMSEIFGEENFVGCFPRLTKKAGKSSDEIAKNHDYVLLFVKDIDKSEFFRELHNDDKFNNKDEFFEERGFYKLNQTLDYDSLGYVKSLDYPIEINGKTYYAGGSFENYQKRQSGTHGRADWGWRWSKELFDFGYKSSFIVVKETKNGSRIYTKTYQKATIKKTSKGYEVIYEDRTKAMSSLGFYNEFSNDNSKSEVEDLLGKGIFDYPKPISLIKHLLKISTKPNDIVLDFFAGSGTTGQAVMELNFEEVQKKQKEGMITSDEPAGSRKFILVQLPEKIDQKKEAFKSGFKFISDITIERVRKASEKYQGIDNGFKVFKLYENPKHKDETDDLFESMDGFILNLVSLFYGYGLNYKTQKLEFGNVYEITSEFEERKALVILENTLLSNEIIKHLIELSSNGINYTIFAKETALNVEIIYNLCNYFKKENIIRL